MGAAHISLGGWTAAFYLNHGFHHLDHYQEDDDAIEYHVVVV